MRPRELAGKINRAKAVFIYVDFSAHPEGYYWLEIPRARAKEIVDDARDKGIEEIAAHANRKGVFIGDPDDFPPEAGVDRRNVRGSDEEE